MASRIEEVMTLVTPMELLDRAVAYTGKHVRSLISSLAKAEDVRKAKRATLVTGQGMYCKKCGNVGPTKRIMKGSFAIELVLWLFFLLPGLVYSIWRLTTKSRGCSVCGSEDVLPRNSPLAKNNASKPMAETTIAAVLCSYCGKYGQAGVSFCPHCGKRTREQIAVTQGAK